MPHNQQPGVEDDPFDTDDRQRCACHHMEWEWVDGKPTGGYVKQQCLKFTRHESGFCADCRDYA